MRDLIIIGAGPAGTSLAAAMARRGWQVLLVERRPLPRHKVCGEFLSPEALQSLKRLGLHQTVRHLGPHVITQACLVSRSGRPLALPLPGEAWGVSRYGLDQALAEAARQAGAEVQTGVTVSQVTPMPGGGYTLMSDGALLAARAVVAAWGRQTPPGLRTHPPPPRERTWVGVKRHYAGLPPGPSVELYFVPGGYVGLAGVETGRVNCAALVTQTAFLRAGAGVESFLRWAQGQNPALAQRLASGGPVPGSEVTVSGVDTGHGPTPWTTLPLLGDAAAVIPPLAGDGMAMALRSSELILPLLEEYLCGNLSLEGWKAGYTKAHQAEFTRRLRSARLLERGLLHPTAGELLLGLGVALPGLADRLLQATRGALCPG